MSPNRFAAMQKATDCSMFNEYSNSIEPSASSHLRVFLLWDKFGVFVSRILFCVVFDKLWVKFVDSLLEVSYTICPDVCLVGSSWARRAFPTAVSCALMCTFHCRRLLCISFVCISRY